MTGGDFEPPGLAQARCRRPVTHPADRDLLDDLSTDRVALPRVPDQPFASLTQDRAERSRASRTRLSAGTS